MKSLLFLAVMLYLPIAAFAQINEGNIELNGFDIQYYFENGEITHIVLDEESRSLIVDVAPYDDGFLGISIPRELLDAMIGSEYAGFFILADGVQIEFSEDRDFSHTRIVIETISTDEQYEIIGTSVYDSSEIPKTSYSDEISTPTLKNTRMMYYYVDQLPDWAYYAANVMQDSTQAWSDANPKLEFQRVYDPTDADFRVQWVKEFAGEHVGYAYSDKFIEVGLGDSICLGSWQPYSADHVADIMKHEIGHILGLDHTDDPNDIMYPIALNTEYGLVEHKETLTNGYAYFHPLCTVKDVTTFSYHVSTNDPVYGFDVYVVPSIQSLNDWSNGESFSYYSDESCYGENYLKYGDSCKGVSGESGVLVIMGSTLTNPLAEITIQIQEDPQNLIFEDIRANEPDLPRLDDPVPYSVPHMAIPDWLKTTAGWWSDGGISDDTFVSMLVFMINDNIIRLGLEQHVIYDSTSVPDWLKHDAKRWADGEISDEIFLDNMRYFIDRLGQI